MVPKRAARPNLRRRVAVWPGSGRGIMDLEYLREFVELVKDANFTRTAGRMGIAQSTLSKHIAAVERAFGVRILERSNLRTELTPAGRLLYEDAQGIVTAYDAALARMESYRKANPLKLRLELFCGYKPTDDLLASTREEFRRSGTVVEIETVDIVKPPLEEIRQGSVDLGLLVHPAGIDMTGLVSLPLVTEPLVAVVSADHPLASRDVIGIEELSGDVVWTIQEEGSRQFALRVEQILLEHDAHPRFMTIPWQNAQSSYTSIAFVDSGVYVTFASVAKFSMPITATRYKVLRFADEDAAMITVSAVWRGDTENPACELAVDTMRGIVEQTDMSTYWK